MFLCETCSTKFLHFFPPLVADFSYQLWLCTSQIVSKIKSPKILFVAVLVVLYLVNIFANCCTVNAGRLILQCRQLRDLESQTVIQAFNCQVGYFTKFQSHDTNNLV